MIRLERILVPTDFSETSEVALTYARALAGNFGAALHVLHVVPDPYTQPWGPEAYGLNLPDLLREMQDSASKSLQDALTPEERNSAGVHAVVAVGNPFVEIVRYAKNQDIDLIVLGTHGRGAVAHMLLGSVAERIVRKAPCPVLTVRNPQHEFVMP
jgi:nucleotide-binding universal stress UspA family protein